MLCLERKRAERSGKMFLLALLDATKVLHRSDGQTMSKKIQSAIFSAIRETDIAGWYKEGSVGGIIFTEVATPDQQVTQNAILVRLVASLQDKVHPQHVEQIRISFHFFPANDKDRSSSGYSVDRKFYPDLSPGKNPGRVSRQLKRAMDIGGSVLGLIVLSPLFALVALAIKLDSEGPVFFRQERVGQYGIPFSFLKFRSMKVSNDPTIHREYAKQFISGNAELTKSADGRDGIFKITKDPRVTSIGKLLRKSSLDELPQLWTVFRGEMSLVGPRPPIPYELEIYGLWHRRRLLEAKPGITGLWQVNGRSKTTFEEMVRLDLQYARMWSLWVDIKILLQTPRAVFLGEGA